MADGAEPETDMESGAWEAVEPLEEPQEIQAAKAEPVIMPEPEQEKSTGSGSWLIYSE